MTHIRVRRAATGWTMRIEDRPERVLEGSVKAELSLELPKSVFASIKKMSALSPVKTAADFMLADSMA